MWELGASVGSQMTGLLGRRLTCRVLAWPPGSYGTSTT